jgi:hypothetical protein
MRVIVSAPLGKRASIAKGAAILASCGDAIQHAVAVPGAHAVFAAARPGTGGPLAACAPFRRRRDSLAAWLDASLRENGAL